MKVFKLVSGILCIVLSVFVTFQSCAAGLGNALAENGEVSGTAGAFVAVMFLAGGIVMIATRNKEGKGGSIACVILFVLAGIMGLANAGSYGDLKIWAVLGLILAAVNLLAAIRSKKPNDISAQ